MDVMTTKTQPETVIAAVITRLREQAQRFNPALESAPVAVLWTDERRDWEAVLPQLKAAMPELFSLGAYLPAERTGPGVWLRMVADRQAGKLAATQVPVLYLPGVANGSLRTDLRHLKDDPHLAPIAELQYRGLFWRQENSKDWTLRAFFESKRGGLGLTVKGDQPTLAALKQALPRLLVRSPASLAERDIDQGTLDEIINPDAADDVLRWLAEPQALRKEKGEGWDSFASTARSRFSIDLNAGPLDAASQVLKARESDSAFVLWERYTKRPQEKPALYDLFKAVPGHDLFADGTRYPKYNEDEEWALAAELRQVGVLAADAAAERLLTLDAQHAGRRSMLWAGMGKAPLAQALQPLAAIAQALRQPAAGGSVAHQAQTWAVSGWQVDAAALQAMAIAQTHAVEAEVYPALTAVYRLWLQRAAETFQQRVAQEGYPARVDPTVPEGTVLLFVDGLRLDLARLLARELASAGLQAELTHGMTSLPSVTSSGKVWCSPGHAAAQTSTAGSGFEPALKVGGSVAPYVAERLRRAIEAAGYEIVDVNAPGVPTSVRGWAEAADDIDADGHNKGLRLAEEAPRHVARLARTVQRLLAAGWQGVRVVTDHGWLLLPGELPKVELPAKLAETRWARCAVVKDSASTVDAQVLPWSYGPEVRIAVAPGIGAFRAGQLYEHGGLTLQECVVPTLDVRSLQPAVKRPAISAVTWNSRKTICKVVASGAEQATVTIERLGNPVGEPGDIDTQGKGQVVFDEVDDLLGETVSILLKREGLKVAEHRLKFGEAWHAAG
ncbi:MAG: hypothetical protein RLY71_2181 [Pseudomonadota bacterium]|jgi:hypothetical protein